MGEGGDGQEEQYRPSSLGTTGRLVLRSFGEDMLEIWGEDREACVAAAMGVVT